jgi:hypothetical protein
VTFNNEIEYYGGPGSTPFFVPKKKHEDDEGFELERLPTQQSQEAQGQGSRNGWLQEQRERKRMVCCLSRKTFIILVVVMVFLLGALLGGVSATLINKKKAEDKRWAFVDFSRWEWNTDFYSAAKPTPTPDPEAFPTVSHVPVPEPTSR